MAIAPSSPAEPAVRDTVSGWRAPSWPRARWTRWLALLLVAELRSVARGAAEERLGRVARGAAGGHRGNSSVASLERNATAGGNASGGARPCRHGVVTVSKRGHREGQEVCTCTYPRSELVNPEGGTDCGLADCAHGAYNFSAGKCDCNDGWRHAGLSSPWEFFQGRCSQHRCVSDQLCQELLGLPFATCPVHGWSCDCGMIHAFYGTGNEHAQCMFPWWALVMQLTNLYTALMQRLWMAVLLVAVCLLPIGRNVLGTVEGYAPSMLLDDLAWSIFALKSGLWLYAFSTVAYMCLVALWLFIAVAAAIVIFVITMMIALAMACMAASGEAGAGAIGDILCCNGGGCCTECGACECADCAGLGGAECCSSCCAATAVDGEVAPMAFYAYEPMWFWYFPTYPGSQLDGGCCCCCSCPGGSRAQRCWTCFAWVPCFRALLALAPRLPENMLGGALGFALGTHPRRNVGHSPQSSRARRLLSRPCWSLSNRSDRWRRHVYEWLHERDAFEALSTTGHTVAEIEVDANSTRMTIGGVAVEQEAGHFTQEDGLFNMNDYQGNECWICQSPGDNWDLWMSCRHAFCQKCSTEMMRRRMPCPFCRVRSATVLRRKALPQVSQEQGSEHEVEGLLEGGGAAAAGPQQRQRSRGSSRVAPQQIPPPRP